MSSVGPDREKLSSWKIDLDFQQKFCNKSSWQMQFTYFLISTLNSKLNHISNKTFGSLSWMENAYRLADESLTLRGWPMGQGLQLRMLCPTHRYPWINNLITYFFFVVLFIICIERSPYSLFYCVVPCNSSTLGDPYTQA